MRTVFDVLVALAVAAFFIAACASLLVQLALVGAGLFTGSLAVGLCAVGLAGIVGIQCASSGL